MHDDGQANTAPVGSDLPNPWGFQDMHGNVSEWRYSRFGPYSQNSVADLVELVSGAKRVMLGGDYNGAPVSLRSVMRSGDYASDEAKSFVDFRVALRFFGE